MLYVCANNLNGWSVSELLPYQNLTYEDNAETLPIYKTIDYHSGYILEVDLHFCTETT